jgi:LacI family transcriptional regulator
VIQQGHEHIVCLYPRYFRQIGNNPFSDPVEENRIHGYRLAMQEAGLEVNIEEYSPGKDSTKNKIVELFSRRPCPTALVCKRDEEALIAAQELMERGFRIPEDVSMISLAGRATEFMPGRKFTYMKYKYRDMGKAAAELVLNTAKEPEAQNLTRSIIGVELVEGESVGKSS